MNRPPPIRTISSVEKEKKTLLYTKFFKRFALISALVLSIYFAVPAFAATVTNPQKFYLGTTEWNTELLKGNYQAFVFSLCYYVYGALPQLAGESGILTIDLTAGYMDTFQALYNSMSSIGLGLAVVWVMLDLIEKAQIDQISPETIIRWCIKMIMAILVVDNADDIAKALIAIGNEMVNPSNMGTPEDMSNGLAVTIDEIFEMLKSAGFIKTTTTLLELLIPALGMIVCLLLMLVMMFGRIIEIGIRFAFMPIGVSDAFTHGISSPGMRYIKKFFAVCLQGAVLYAIIIVGSSMMGQVSTGAFGFLSHFGIITQLVIAFSMIGAMLKSQSIINDIAGV